MASIALLRRLPSPALSPSPQLFHPLRLSRAMRVLAAPKPHLNLQTASSKSPSPKPDSLLHQSFHFQAEQELSSGDSALKGLALAIAVACPALLLAPTALAMESGEILRLSATELDPSTAKLAITVLSPLFAAFNLMFIVRIVMSWYPQIPVGKFPFSIAYAPTEPVLGPTRRLIPPVGGVDVAPVIWVALMSFLNEILLGSQGLLVLLSQQQP